MGLRHTHQQTSAGSIWGTMHGWVWREENGEVGPTLKEKRRAGNQKKEPRYPRAGAGHPGRHCPGGRLHHRRCRDYHSLSEAPWLAPAGTVPHSTCRQPPRTAFLGLLMAPVFLLGKTMKVSFKGEQGILRAKRAPKRLLHGDSQNRHKVILTYSGRSCATFWELVHGQRPRSLRAGMCLRTKNPSICYRAPLFGELHIWRGNRCMDIHVDAPYCSFNKSAAVSRRHGAVKCNMKLVRQWSNSLAVECAEL